VLEALQSHVGTAGKIGNNLRQVQMVYHTHRAEVMLAHCRAELERFEAAKQELQERMQNIMDHEIDIREEVEQWKEKTAPRVDGTVSI